MAISGHKIDKDVNINQGADDIRISSLILLQAEARQPGTETEVERQYVIAGIRLCILSEMQLENRGWSGLFETDGREGREFRIKVKTGKLPQYPGGAELYSGPKRRTVTVGNKLVSYYREPNRTWQFCYKEEETCGKLIVVPEVAHYAYDIRNIWDKIDFSRILLKNNALILHASYIIWNGRGILFTAPSGTGKSTQAELWKRYRGARIINGDRAVIRKKEGRLWAYSLPFAGSSGICLNKDAPLDAIAVLEQAGEDEVYRMSGLDSVKHLYTQCAVNRWNAEEVSAVTRLLENMSGEAEIVKLRCRPCESAVDVLETYLEKREKEKKTV